jgi:hypothetical protein
MSKASQAQLYEEERKALREELYSLKNCQITFLTTSITATGLISGLAASIAPEPYQGFAFFFPLIVLLPSWWIFFDKATTITRVVGYYRILESLILDRCVAENFIGWENSLGLFRQMQKEGKLRQPKDKVKVGFLDWMNEMIFYKTTHRYWITAYYTFFALSGVCVLIGFFLTSNIWIGLFLSILFIISAIWNARMVWFLIHKKYSYDWNEDFWRQILKVKKIASSSG